MVDVSGDLQRLAADLSVASAEIGGKVRHETQVSAGNIRDTARSLISGLRHAPHYPRSITYETDYDGNVVEAVIGPDKNKRQGALGNILEYGTVNNAPLAHLGPALDREAPDWQRRLTDVAADIL